MSRNKFDHIEAPADLPARETVQWIIEPNARGLGRACVAIVPEHLAEAERITFAKVLVQLLNEALDQGRLEKSITHGYILR